MSDEADKLGQSASKTPEKPQTIPPLLVRPHVESHEYEIYAPENSYDPNIKPGKSNILILEARPNESRHDDLVAHLTRLSAEDTARHLHTNRPQIHVRGGSPSHGNDENPNDTQAARVAALNQYDVINYSAGVSADNYFSIISSSAGGNDPAQMFTGLQRPIIVQAVGNHGNDGGQLARTNHDLDTADNAHFYRHTITVGEATKDIASGKFLVDAHSARSGPTLVAENFSDTGTKFMYYDGPAQFMLQKSPEMKMDQDGFVSGIQGTSFAAPTVSGSIGTAKEAFPKLTNSDVIAAAVTSARIPKGQDVSEVTIPPAGLQYGQHKWGFGVFDTARFKESLDAMDDLRRKHGPTQETSAETSKFTRDQVTHNGQNYNAHSFVIDQDSTVQKISLVAQMPLRTRPADHVILIDPTGNAVNVPTSIGGGLSRITTEAFMGAQAKGEWKVLMPGESRIRETPEERLASQSQTSSISQEQPALFRIDGVENGPDGKSNISRLFELEQQKRKAEALLAPPEFKGPTGIVADGQKTPLAGAKL